MKHFLLILGFLSLVCTTNAQKKVDVADLPNGVSRNFKAIYQEAFNVFWTKTDTSFIAEFTMNETKTHAFFGINGDLLRTEYQLPTDQLPKKIKTVIADQHKGCKIKEAAMIRKPGGENEYSFRVIITQKKTSTELLFNQKYEPQSTNKK